MLSGRTFPLIEVGESVARADGVVQYVLVFVFAAFPWVEILVVIPVAVGVGLNPITAGIVAFLGNVGSVYGLLAFHRRIARWRARRNRAERESDSGGKPKHARARSVWDRYGLPGLALAAPVLTGVHIAALLAIAAGGTTRAVAGLCNCYEIQ